MKGVIFNLVEGVVTKTYGEKMWDTLLEKAGLEGSYTSLGGYPDRELFQILHVASEMLGKNPDDVLQWLARESMPLLAAKYSEFFVLHTATRPFLLTLNEVIHPEVRKLFPGADVPEFEYVTSSASVLVMVYRSPRKMCSFALGLIEGATDYYRETLFWEHPRCMKLGQAECEFRLSFAPQPG